MAGLIRRDDIETLRERVQIEDVIGQYVGLRPAGVGALKGLCPFHDEKSPSFQVRPQVGRYHCFGCGEGGDVINFVQKIDGLGFTEAVEHLAARVGMTLRYEEGGAPRPGEEPGRRRRLLDAHKLAEEFFVEQLTAATARAARDFLSERGFDRTAAEQFQVGYAPTGWDVLLRHLRGRGFTEPELVASGLFSQGQRGVYDRFRGRLVWPIREVTGETVGFGARRLLEEDKGPKYLNTPETILYRKSQVLYGIDLAKREISRRHQVVVVEGYTDVMAMHLSGIGGAVATCGTAFGPDHARIVRRLLGDAGGAGGVQLAGGRSVGGEVVFTFDGDAAGRAAALKAFGEDQTFAAQTFVAVEPNGLDPCDLRQQRGPDAVRALVQGRQPLFEFVVRQALSNHDLGTAEGRVGALRAAAPVVAGIRDTALKPEYTRLLAGWLGLDDDPTPVRRAVASAGRTTAGGPVADRSKRDSHDPVTGVERQTLEGALQNPDLVPAIFDELQPGSFTTPMYRAVHQAIRAAGGIAAGAQMTQSAWVQRVGEEAGADLQGLVNELAVAQLPVSGPDAVKGYVGGITHKLVDLELTRRIADLRGHLQRTPDTDDAYQRLFAQLLDLDQQRRQLRESS